jgi:methylated-DNA-[protein]-cysteine S-methyltransferase
VAGERSVVTVETAVGVLCVETTDAGVVRVRLPGDTAARGPAGVVPAEAAAIARSAASELAEYARGEREVFDVPLDWSAATGEHRRVLETLCGIAPYGRTVTYGELGEHAGIDDPRDVGLHMNRNPLPIVVPCHRVVASDGLGGYGGGLALKRRLLELEGALPPSLDLGDL